MPGAEGADEGSRKAHERENEMNDLKALTECSECTWDYIDRLRMALTAACKERDELKKAYDAMARDLAARTRQVRKLQGASAALRQQGQERNAPITLAELRQMDGDPVYCVEITCREEWLFRRDGGFADMYGEWTSDDFMSWDNYGKLWWCYRQKPEEGTV